MKILIPFVILVFVILLYLTVYNHITGGCGKGTIVQPNVPMFYYCWVNVEQIHLKADAYSWKD